MFDGNGSFKKFLLTVVAVWVLAIVFYGGVTALIIWLTLWLNGRG